MSTLSIKRFAAPDETRKFAAHGDMRMLKFGDRAIGLGTFEPGWRWSQDLRPLVGTPSCQASHQVYVLSGVLHVKMDDGQEADLRAGDVAMIAPGHDAWVIGNDQAVVVDFGEVQDYARPQAAATAAAQPRPEARH